MFNSKIKIALLLLIIISFLFLFNQAVLADDQSKETAETVEPKCTADFEKTEGNIKIYSVTCKSGDVIEDCRVGWLINNPCCACCGDCTLNDALGLAANIARQLFKYLGVIALVVFIIGGIMWMTSGGNTQQIERGKKLITGAVIGLVIVISAFLIVQTLMKVLGVEKEYWLREAPTPEKRCEDLGEEYSCQEKSICELEYAWWLEGLCPGGENIVCCKRFCSSFPGYRCVDYGTCGSGITKDGYCMPAGPGGKICCQISP